MSPVFNALCIPQAQVVVACDENLVRVRELMVLTVCVVVGEDTYTIYME